MRLIIITGFLGSGKTTFLLGLVRGLISREGLDFVILENEVGEISIDGAYLEMQGLQVKELFSGCVCCQLAGDLVVTLRDIKEALDPDCVLLEASGLARIESIRDTLDKYCPEVGKPLVITLVDLERPELFMEEPIPFVINQVKLADLLILNKADTGGPDLLESLQGKLAETNPRAEIIAASSLQGTNLERAAEKVMAWIQATS